MLKDKIKGGYVKKTSKTRLNKEQRRQQILDDAMSVFVKNGFTGSTTSEIAKAAGISEITLYRHFNSKQEVFLEGIEPVFFHSIKESLDEYKHLDNKSKLEHLLIKRILFIKENRDIIKLILKESNLLEEIVKVNYIEDSTEMVKDTLKHIDIHVCNESYAINLIVSTFLNFLYTANNSQEYIEDYVKWIVSILINTDFSENFECE